eukprot:840694-Rhodomonas_salina.3
MTAGSCCVRLLCARVLLRRSASADDSWVLHSGCDTVTGSVSASESCGAVSEYRLQHAYFAVPGPWACVPRAWPCQVRMRYFVGLCVATSVKSTGGLRDRLSRCRGASGGTVIPGVCASIGGFITRSVNWSYWMANP